MEKENGEGTEKDSGGDGERKYSEEEEQEEQMSPLVPLELQQLDLGVFFCFFPRK